MNWIPRYNSKINVSTEYELFDTIIILYLNKKNNFYFFLLFSSFVGANEISGHAQGLKEVLITVTTLDNKDQQDILLLKPDSDQPKYLSDFFWSINLAQINPYKYSLKIF